MGNFKNIIAKLSRSCTTFKKKDEGEGGIQETTDGNSPNQPRILDLPTSILIEIFLTLSIKTILNCRCVCKRFSTVLRHTDFLDAYQMKPNLAMILKERGGGKWIYPFYLLELADDLGGCTPKPVLANIPPNEGRLYVLGSCNGLVCIAEVGGLTSRFIYICNPILGEYSKLPLVGNTRVPVSYGFGFDPSTDHYKVVRILAESTPIEGGVVGTYAEIFTVGVDVKWRTLKHATGPNILGPKGLILFLEVNQLFRSVGLLFQGAIHWILDHGSYWFDRRTFDFICAFDIVEENFRSIPAPSDMIIERGDSYSLLVLRDYLSILTFLDSNELNIWTMRQYGVVESWCKEYSIIENWISRCRNYCSLRTSAIMRGDAEILMFSPGIGVICYNLEEMKYTETKVANIYMFGLEHNYRPSLFSLNNILSGEGVKVRTVRKKKRWFSVE